ncbi:MAG: crossover junction endodeoxyribonuclease RuvC [Thiotrichales bacterium]
MAAAALPVQRILGIDPGSRITGFGVIDSDGRDSRHVASGSIHLRGAGLPERLGEIFRAIDDVIAEHRPTVVAIERVFFARNPDSALKLGQARGAAICACMQHTLELHEYATREVKQGIVGSGAADKKQMQYMVGLLLKQSRGLAEDEADALALALCHAHIGRFQQRLAQGLAR